MEKRFGISVVIIFLVSIFALSVLATRLPTSGGDNNAWGDVLNAYLQVAHDDSGQIKANYISSNMISDLTINAIDLNATAIVNATHISASAVNGTHVSTTTVVNVSSVIVNGFNRTINNGGAVNVVNQTNISGILMNYTRYDVPSLSPAGGAAANCITIPINMTGVPANAWCMPLSDPSFGNFNLTITGTNSTVNNCRVLVCNPTVNYTIDPPGLAYGAIAFVSGSGLYFGFQ